MNFWYVETIACPRCGYEGELDNFDVGGACDGQVFCPQCHQEFDSVTRDKHDCEKSGCQSEAT